MSERTRLMYLSDMEQRLLWMYQDEYAANTPTEQAQLGVDILLALNNERAAQAALRARHEKLRDLAKAYLRRTLTGDERKELNALLEDE